MRIWSRDKITWRPAFSHAAFFCLVAIACCLASRSRAGFAAEKAFELREHLGVAWRDELVTFKFEFPEAECHPESLRLMGPAGLVPVQVVSSRCWPGDSGYLRSATIGFFADLGPLAADRYVLSWDRDPSTMPPAPASGLTVRRSGNLVAVASHAFGAVFQTGGEVFAEPVDAATAPGPVRHMLLPDGRRFGGSRLYGETKIASWSGEMTASGPVFADIRWRYRYADGTEFQLRGRLGARDTAIYWDMSCKGTLPGNGWRLGVSDGLPPLSLSVQIEHFSRRSIPGRALKPGDFVSLPVATLPTGKMTSVTPWADWTDDSTQTVMVLNEPDGVPAFFAASRDPGAWIEPLTGPGEVAWGRVQKSLPVVKREDGLVELVMPVMDEPGGGLRRWMTGVLPAGTWDQVVEISKNKQAGVVQQQLQLLVDKRRLDWVKDFVLDWPEKPRSRPMLIVSRDDVQRCRSRKVFPQQLAERLEKVRETAVSSMPDSSDGVALAAWLLSGLPRMAADVRLVERARQRLALLGNFDTMRSAPLVAVLYDGVVDSGLVSDSERRLMRSRMAYLGYRMEDPAMWSTERGYNTGLPNMNVSFALGRGIVACGLPDHPRAGLWMTPALENMDRWLETRVGKSGEWMEGASYDHVTASTMIAFAIAAKNAGFRDYSQHEKFKLFLEYIAKQYTPPDPSRGDIRVTPPLGRANAGVRMGLFGVMARFTRDSDPGYASGMQWMWRQSGELYPIADNRLCGLEYLYIDPQAPANRPNWGSEWFPLSTVVLRNRFGAPQEDYVNILPSPDPEFARPSEAGSLLQWFAFGTPVAGAFTEGYRERHEMLMSRVVPSASPTAEEWQATNFHKIESRVTSFFTQPRVDYVDVAFQIGESGTFKWPRPEGMPEWPPVARSATTPISWRRQLLFVKGSADNEPAYLVFRDTVASDQPTLWQFWSLSNGIREAGAAHFKPIAETSTPAQSLGGRRFTAVGQHGVDLEFFVVTPEEPEAYTLRWGTRYQNPPDIGRREYRDLLQLRREGRGSYVVVIVPRPRGGSEPRISAEAEGRVIRVRHAGGEDLIVLNDGTSVTTADGDAFAVPAACLYSRGQVRMLILGPRGTATIDDQLFETEVPAEFPVGSNPTR